MQLDDLMQQYVDEIQIMDSQVLRCLGLIDDGDRVAYYVHAEYTFLLGQLLEQDLNLNNPFDSTFFGQRLNLYLGSRLSDQSGNDNSELTFRPDDWTPVNDWPAPTIKAANCTFSIRTSKGPYSSAPMSIAHAFSCRAGVPDNVQPMAVSAYLGGLDFHRDFPIPRGESMMVKVTPNYTRALASDGAIPDLTSVPEYRVSAVLQGYKVARAFR
jgi:hypothetical protein